MKKIGYIIGLLILLSITIDAASLKFEWRANPEPDIAGYVMYYGIAPGVYTNSLNVNNVTNYVISGLAYEKTYYFALTAYNTVGLESIPSTELAVIVSTNYFSYLNLIEVKNINTNSVRITYKINCFNTVEAELRYGTDINLLSNRTDKIILTPTNGVSVFTTSLINLTEGIYYCKPVVFIQTNSQFIVGPTLSLNPLSQNLEAPSGLHIIKIESLTN